MSVLDLSAEELALVEDALEGHLEHLNDEIERLEDLEFDGMYVDEWEFEDNLRNEVIAEELLMQIDEIWYDLGYGFPEDEDWFQEDDFFDDYGWDEPAEIEEEEMADA